MTISPNKWELDVQGYLNVCNISAATPRQQIRDFAKGVNDLGLWNSMVCWPLRSSQNYGSGTTAFSLGGLGTFNGTLVDGPTWGSDGITASGGAKVSSTRTLAALPSYFSVLKPATAAGGADNRVFALGAGVGSNLGADFQAADQFRGLLDAGVNFGTRTVGQFCMVGIGRGASNTFTFFNGTRSALTDQSYSQVANQMWVIGTSAATNTASAEYAFTLGLEGVAATSEALSSVYTLYKTTLGTGLSLP